MLVMMNICHELFRSFRFGRHLRRCGSHGWQALSAKPEPNSHFGLKRIELGDDSDSCLIQMARTRETTNWLLNFSKWPFQCTSSVSRCLSLRFPIDQTSADAQAAEAGMCCKQSATSVHEKKPLKAAPFSAFT